ncbi:MAG: amidohydrolase family protein [Cytophagaceae bacterium]|nr:amidohydrolase family protein [Gemmatimonadaceae bacterium]
MYAIGLALQLVVVTNTTVIDPSTGRATPGQAILINGSRVQSIAPAARATIPASALRIDGQGKFVIPGLWDMHVHNDVPGGGALLPLYVAYGVTGVRDMDGRLAPLRAWQKEIQGGTRVGPRMVISGPYIVGQRVPLPSLTVTTPAEGRAAVDSLAALGVDFIKVHNGMTPDTYFAVARRARERGIVFAGHVFNGVTPVQASDSGQRSEEHLSGFPNECTVTDSARLAAAHPLHRFLLGGCTTRSQEASYRRLAANGTWVTPTLIVQQPVAAFQPSVARGDRLSTFFSDSLLAMMSIVMPIPRDATPLHRTLGLVMYDKRIAMVGALSRAGVPLLTGSDTPVAPAVPGEAIHEELALMVRGGLTPLEALRAATWEPARYLNATDSLGTIAAGKVADLVVLDANPLLDIANVRRVHAVVSNGRAFDRAALDALIAAARVRQP